MFLRSPTDGRASRSVLLLARRSRFWHVELLAVAEHRGTRARKGLARLLAHDLTSRGLADPRAWSSRLESDAIERARTKLG